MKQITALLCVSIFCAISVHAQNSVAIDGRLQPHLNDFFEYCKEYDIEYHEKLFQLKEIDIVDTLPLGEKATVLGKVYRDDAGMVEGILINWAALIDPEITRVVAFHEFAHHFLDYKHTCQDCNEIMAVTNSSYFTIASEWDAQVRHLFETSPVYLAQVNQEQQQMTTEVAK